MADASREISIVALNALLTARQAGVRSRGFSVVSREVRQLAARLDEAMGGLDLRVSELTSTVAILLRERRMLDYLDRTRATSDSHASIVAAVERIATLLRKQEQLVAERRAMLNRDILNALRYAEMGIGLARSAKIEAVHGGAMAPVLKQVAEQIEKSLDTILTYLRAAIRLANEGG